MGIPFDSLFLLFVFVIPATVIIFIFLILNRLSELEQLEERIYAAWSGILSEGSIAHPAALRRGNRAFTAVGLILRHAISDPAILTLQRSTLLDLLADLPDEIRHLYLEWITAAGWMNRIKAGMTDRFHERLRGTDAEQTNVLSHPRYAGEYAKDYAAFTNVKDVRIHDTGTELIVIVFYFHDPDPDVPTMGARIRGSLEHMQLHGRPIQVTELITRPE